MTASFTYLKGNCPICQGTRDDCRQSNTTGLVHCRADAPTPTGWHIAIESDQWGFTAYGQDSGEWQQQPAPLAKTYPDALPPKDRDRQYRKWADCAGLSEPHRQMLANRGLEAPATPLYWSLGGSGHVDGLSANLAGVEPESIEPRPLKGMAIAIPSVSGRILGAQYRPDYIGDGPKYLWLSSDAVGGSSPHLANGELPIGIYGNRSWLGNTLYFSEGFLKSNLAAQLHKAVFVGASSGAWAGSPEQLKCTIGVLKPENFVLCPDGGMLDERHKTVIHQYERLYIWLKEQEHELTVAWWGQDQYEGQDVDEIKSDRFRGGDRISWREFLGKLEYQWSGPSTLFKEFPRAKKAQLVEIPKDAALDVRLKMHCHNINLAKDGGDRFQVVALECQVLREFPVLSRAELNELCTEERQETTENTGLVHISNALINCWETSMENAGNGGQILGVPSGFESLDRMTQGQQKGDLIITAARPSMGKTSYVINTVTHSAKHSLPCAVFSLEMSKEQLAYRLISAESRVDAMAFKSGRLNADEWARVGQTYERLLELPIYVDDTSLITVEEIRNKISRLQSEMDSRVGLVAIDYLQIMGGITEDRNSSLSKITGRLKAIAKEFDTPVNCLSQLSRNVENRTDKRPKMSDLRDSGAIEQDADVITMLYRDEYYNKDTVDRGVAEVIIVKNRNGPTGTVKLLFEPEYTQFRDIPA